MDLRNVPLAVTDLQRDPSMPQLATLDEQGLLSIAPWLWTGYGACGTDPKVLTPERRHEQGAAIARRAAKAGRTEHGPRQQVT